MPKSRNNSSRNNNKSSKKGVAKEVRQIITSMAEHKKYIYTLVPLPTIVAGSIQSITQGITQGDDISQRSGGQITVESLKLRLNAALPVGAQVATFRFILVADQMSNGSVVGVGDILQTATVVSPFNLVSQNAKRFTVLHDKIYPLVFGGADQQIAKVYDIKRKVRIQYYNPGNVGAANGRNAIFGLAITDTAINSPIITFSVDVHYVDM